MVKRTNSTGNWNIQDSSRNSINPTNRILLPNGANGEEQNSVWNVDFVSNGFKIRTADGLWNDGTYIFAAFAESPFKTANAK